jgi:hypothetical protein
MLGDGIYFTNVIDKATQYISDHGYSRGIGQEGYFLRMKAALGDKYTDYRSAGIPGSTDRFSTVSPEWAVFNPSNQLQVYRAFFIKTISKGEMDALKKKVKLNESTSNYETYITEARIKKESGSVSSYCFRDGLIPTGVGAWVAFDDFDVSAYRGKVEKDYGRDGPIIRIKNTDESKVVNIRRIGEIVYNRRNLEEFLSDLKG